VVPDVMALVVLALNVTVLAVFAVTVVPVVILFAVTNIPKSMSDVEAKFKVVPAAACAAFVILEVFCSVVPRYLCTSIPVPPTVNNSEMFLSKYL
jgi:hypothetical protein